MSDEQPGVGIVDQMTPYAQHDADRQYIAKAGSPAKHARGVLFLGPWGEYADGFSEHVRRQARALQLGGVPVHLRTFEPRFKEQLGEEAAMLANVQDMTVASVAVYGAQVNMLVPVSDTLSNLTRHRHYSVEQQQHINSKRVFYTVWERQSGVSAGDVAAFNSAGQCWVPTQQAKALLQAAGVTSPVYVHPCPYIPGDPLLTLNGRTRRAGPVRFYHVGKWEHRKAHHELFGAFLRAVKPGEATLLFKTSGSAPRFQNYPEGPANSLERWLEDGVVKANGWTRGTINRGIVIVDRRLSYRQMVELHAMGDVYLSLSRGEGFDMPAFDAKLAGNLMVYTPSGGPQEFCGEDDVRVEPSGLVDCDPFYGWPKEAKYLDWYLDDAAAAIQTATGRIVDGKRSRGMDMEPFSVQRVGDRMAEDLDRLEWR